MALETKQKDIERHGGGECDVVGDKCNTNIIYKHFLTIRLGMREIG